MADGVVPTRPLCGDHEPHLPHQFVMGMWPLDCAGFAPIAPNGCDDCSVEQGERHRYPACPGVRDQMPKAEAKPNSENAPNSAAPTPPYTEATVELVADAVAEATLSPAIGGTRRHARLVLDALVKAGLLLPEGAETQYAAGVAAGRAQAAADIRAVAVTGPRGAPAEVPALIAETAALCALIAERGVDGAATDEEVDELAQVIAEGGGEADHPNASQDRADDEVNHV